MTRAGIRLDHMAHPRVGQGLFEAVLLFLGEARVLDGARDVHAAGDIFYEEMGAVGLVRSQVAAVKRCDRRKSLRERAGRRQGAIAAHAIAGGPESIALYLGTR